VGLLAIHTNLPAVFPPDAAQAIASGGPAPARLSEKERAEFDAMQSFIKNGGWGIPDDDERATAGRWLRLDRLPGWPRGVDARARRLGKWARLGNAAGSTPKKCAPCPPKAEVVSSKLAGRAKFK
jgi:hypothetical protein